ncbi:MAG: hypothetical protein ABS76_30795 [Pelagibacterium sp. SCN 64-44]|nr:MAG: hypothetical protein ABS76_30795 [Pelagibacterium sp. SCN 64-44]
MTAENTLADELDLNGVFRLISEPEQSDETLEVAGKFLSLPGLELAHQRLLELGPVIGQAFADARAAAGEGNALGQLGADGLAGDQFALGKAGKARFEGGSGQAQFLGQRLLGGAGAPQREEDGIVTRLQTPFEKGQQQRLVRELPGLDEPVES